ncbi:DUF6404 family protein [Aliivibrio fischeri]|uniref:DUF2628 domain-containing protein n=1 Tax=Aliivibrio fischeri SR5 TaxID=1088719 RepID=A0AAV3EMD9_ALIFS|nr:DUF6404 family protein [Aliivibrio fischeri]EHN68038.1 hypothetical protein VFSR5_A0619 [Aliivibrio fischeri SR5]
MKKSEFIQLYLKEKGVSTWLTKPYPLLFSKLTKTKWKPRLFESPLKLFFLQSVFGSVSWGFFMWLIIWQFNEFSIYNLYGALFFGLATGTLLALDAAVTQKRLNLTNWEQWLEDNHFN